MGLALLADQARAAYTLDRWFQMGDDKLFSGGPQAENAANGAPVGSGNSFTGINGAPVTYDSAATTTDNFQPLAAFGGNGLPTYVQYGLGGNPAAPLPAAASMNSFGIRFDGVDDYLAAINLNDPSIAAPGSTITYNTQNRGMQLWVYPTAIDGVPEYVIDDADEHGFNITAAGNWLGETNENRDNSNVPAVQNAWTHVMLVRDSVIQRTSVFYVNGRAVVTQPLNYDGNNVTNLLVGANAEDNAGTTQDPNVQVPPTFFSGIVDEIELFVIDDGTTYGAFDYTKDNGYFTDVFLPMQSGYGFTLNTNTGHNSQQWLKGDINFDGNFDQLDVNAFIAGWLSAKNNLPGAGLQAGDFQSLALGDLDLDGDTDLGDWVRLRLYNAASGAALTIPSLSQLNGGVPEPGSLTLLAVVGMIAMVVRGRRRHYVALFALAVFSCTPSARAVNLFSDTYDRATTQVDDIDATTTGMSGTAAPLTLVENGDDTLVPAAALPSPAAMTNIENNQLHVADGTNATTFYLNHNFVESTITTDGLLSIKLDLVSNDGASVDNNRFIGFGVGSTLAEFQGQAQLDNDATAASRAMRGNVNVANAGFADLWIGWSPNGGGTIQVVKNGNLARTIADGVTNSTNGLGYLQPSAALGQPATLELRMAVASFNSGRPVPFTVYYNGVAVGGDAFRWENTGVNYIGINARQSEEGFTADNLAITTSTAALNVQTLSLEVYTNTGEAFLVGGPGSSTIDRYTISSASGLVSGNFNGIRGDQGLPAGNGSGNGWELGGVQTNSLLSEFYLGPDGQGSSTLGSSFRASLGNIYNTVANTRDLMVQYRLTDGAIVNGAATYLLAPGGLAGDFNGNNVVDAADYVVWRKNLGSSSPLPNDNGLGVPIGPGHYAIWRSNFGNGQGSGSMTNQSVTVPEPGSALLTVVGLLAAIFGKFRASRA